MNLKDGLRELPLLLLVLFTVALWCVALDAIAQAVR